MALSADGGPGGEAELAQLIIAHQEAFTALLMAPDTTTGKSKL